MPAISPEDRAVMRESFAKLLASDHPEAKRRAATTSRAGFDRDLWRKVSEKGPSLMLLGKLAMSGIQRGEARLRREMLGAEGLLDDASHSEARDANFDSAKAYMHSIGGGTDLFQRDIIFERILDLPREHEADRAIPFREVTSG